MSQINWEISEYDAAIETALQRVGGLLNRPIRVIGTQDKVFRCQAIGLTGRQVFETLALQAKARQGSYGVPSSSTMICGPGADGVILCSAQEPTLTYHPAWTSGYATQPPRLCEFH